MTGYIQVVTTTDSRADAERIARTLVEKRVAGCVQILGPVSSTYRWQGEIETADEWLCLIKSKEDRYADLERAILEVHSYDVPEILAMPVVAGSADYLQWLAEELRAEG
jgi:periplasmic divalent cation tolerance protein